MYDPKYAILSDDEIGTVCSEVFEKLKVTMEEADFLEQTTRGQSNSVVWYDYRKGRVTASCFFDAYRHMCSLQCYPKSLIKKIMQYESVAPSIPSLKWGREKETEARSAYIKSIEKNHKDFIVNMAGEIRNTHI